MKFPHTPQGVIFDMDGLLIDTISLYITAMSSAGKQVGHPVTNSYLYSLVGLLGVELRNRLVQDWGDKFPVDDFLHESEERLAQVLNLGAPLKPGAADLLAYLSSIGLPVAVATSMKRREAEHQLSCAGLRHYFLAVVGRDDVPRSKPHPDVYFKATAQLNRQPQACVALEDSFNGIRSAHGAGCMVIMVPDVLPPTAEMQALCVGIASDLHEVQAIL